MPSEEEFIEHMGQLFEDDNMARTAGRMFGHLLLVEEPETLAKLADALQVSKASVSTNARLLAALGIIERLTVPGDRRDFYQVSETGHQRMLDLRVQRIQMTRELLAEALRTDAAKNPRVRSRLEYFGKFFDLMIAAIAEARDAMSAKRSGNRK